MENSAKTPQKKRVSISGASRLPTLLTSSCGKLSLVI